MTEGRRSFFKGETNKWSRRRFLKTTAGATVAAVAGPTLAACGGDSGKGGGAAKVGILADMSGPLAVFGKSYWNTARLAAEDVNKAGGVLGKDIELVLQDSASDNTVAVQKAGQLVQQQNADVVIGGLTSSMREAVKSVIVERGRTLYIYPNIYEGDSCHPLQFNTGPVPPQVVEPLIPWLFKKAGGKKIYYTGADYIFPRVSLKHVRRVAEENGGEVIGTEFFPLDATDFSTSTRRILDSGADIVYTNVIPPGIWAQIRQLTDGGFRDDGLLCMPYLEESALEAIPFSFLEGIPSCLDFFQALDDPFDAGLVQRYRQRFGEKNQLSSNGAVGTYRAVRLWAQAANKADTLDAEAVRDALDSESLKESPGGPAEMVPSQHHLALNMYLGVAEQGKMVVKENFGKMQPNSSCDFPV
jgi:ABC-type branched-subunit amino acid transport system substrate-binding protein